MAAYFYDHIKKTRHNDVDIRLLALSERRSDKTQTLLRFARNNQLEIRCSCLPIPARMFVRLAFDYFTIVNHKKEGLHHKHCPLIKQLNNTNIAETHNESPETHDFLKEGFSLHPKMNKNQTTRTTSHASTSIKVTKPHRLLTLYQHLTQTTFNHSFFKGKHQSFKKILFDFKRACDDIDFGDQPLSDWVFYGDKAYKQAFTKLFAYRDKWQGAGRPHCFIFFISEQVTIDDHLLTINNGCFQLQKIVKQGDISKECFIAMSLSFNEKTNTIAPHTAFVQPIQSMSLALPVSSLFEREVATALTGIVSVHSSKHLKWSFFKPIQSKEENGLLPNFILQAKHHNGQLSYRKLIFIEDGKLHCHANNAALLHSLSAYKANDVLRINAQKHSSISSLFITINSLIASKEILENE